MGDQKAQYTRLRDYLQAIIDTNPGSRCIVTTKHLVEHPKKAFTIWMHQKKAFLMAAGPS